MVRGRARRGASERDADADADAGGERGLSPRKRAAILRAAGDAFRRDGFHAATMDAIAEDAGVSKRTVYNHFPSKDVLFDVVTEDLWGQLAAGDEAARDRSRTVEQRLAVLAREKLGALIDPRVVGLLRAVLGDQARSPELLRAYGGGRGQLGLSRLLDEEVAAGRLAIEHVDLAAAQFWGLTLGSLFWPLVIGFRTAPDETEREIVIEEAVRTFVARYGVKRRARGGA
jgi:TetR/AcrR family transcriptional regulator of autoinduction and epiphytic fitness